MRSQTSGPSPKGCAEANRNLGRYRLAFAQDVVQVLAGNPERLGDFLLDQLVQKLAHSAAHLLLERIDPLASLKQNRRSHGTVSHGVVSSALVTP